MFRAGFRLPKYLSLITGKCGESTAICMNFQKRELSSSHTKIQTLTKTLSFAHYMSFRRNEASRTIVFQVDHENKYNELLSHCLQYGPVKSTFLYQGNRKENLILVEFETKDSADEVIRTHKNLDTDNVQWSRYPIFTETLRKAAPERNVADTVPLDTALGQRQMRRSELYRLLIQKQSVDEQIDTLFRRTCMNDLLIRHRYLALVQIEDAARGLSPNVRAYPFGSSASGFGKSTSDLDMVIVNHDLTISSMSSIMEYMPGVCNLNPLPNATVQIIKYQQGFFNLEVDISFDVLRGVYGTELLYFCCQLEPRLRPLIFCLRWWADRMGICRITSGPWIKNYAMNLMTVFYLQQQKILPPLSAIANLSRTQESDSEATFITDIKTLDFKTTNTDSVAELFVGFLKYYSEFAFNEHAMCIDQGILVAKVDPALIDVIDLFGTENSTTNVSRREFKKIKSAFKDSNAVQLEFDKATADEPWGLVKYFQACEEKRYRRKERIIAPPV